MGKYGKLRVNIILLILLALPFRVFSPDLMEYKPDEAITVYKVLQFFEEPHFYSEGLASSTGVRSFPLFYYLLTIFAFITRDPVVLATIIAVINVIAIIIFFLLMKRFYATSTAFFAAALLATSPWMIIFSRKVWTQDLIMLFSVPAFYFLHKIILDKNFGLAPRSFSVVGLFLLLTLLAQLHLPNIFFFGITIIILLVRLRHLEGGLACPERSRRGLLRGEIVKGMLLGILIGLIPAIPYFARNITSGCTDCQALIAYQQEEKLFSPELFARPFQILGGLGFSELLGEDYPVFLEKYPFITVITVIPIGTSLLILILLGVGFILARKRQYIFLTAYIVLVPLVLFLTQTPRPATMYSIIIAPFVALTAALALEFFSKRRTIIVIIFITVITGNLLFNFSFFSFLNERKVINGDYGPTYWWLKNRAENELKGADLVYTYFLLGKVDQAEQELTVLEKYDPLSAEKLRIQFSDMLE